MPRTRNAGNKRVRAEEPEPVTLSQKLQRKMAKSAAAAVKDRTSAREPRTNSKKAKLQSTETEAPKNIMAAEKKGLASSNFSCDFSQRKSPPLIPVSSLFLRMQRSPSLIHLQYQTALGLHASFSNRQSLKDALIQSMEDLSYSRVLNDFDRRTTALEWHPSQPCLLVAASKAGDMLVWDVNSKSHKEKTQGIGPGGNITAIRFHPDNPNLFYITALDGRLTSYSLEKLDSITNVLYTGDWEHWFTSLDVSGSSKLMLAGDNLGLVHAISFNLESVFTMKLHKNKVTHAEFSPREPWLLCTASVDHTVKMWDIRNIKDRNSYLACLQHNFGINSAHFSGTDGCRLLTTDQGSELRVYRAPHWQLERTIPHPHRFFQHLTPIKATWHPLQDLIVVGRYPDPNFPLSQSVKEKYIDDKCIDIIDADTGAMYHQITEPQFHKISSLNKFNPTGEILASGMGQMVVVRRKPQWDSHYESEVHQIDLDKVKDHQWKRVDSALPRRNRGGTSRREKTPKNKMNPSKTK